MNLKSFWLKKRLILLMGNFLFLIIVSWGQKPTSVSGVVSNEKGESLPNVTVTAQNQSTHKIYKTMTDTLGKFVFEKLESTGTYSFDFSSIGYKPHRIAGYKLKSEENTTLLVTLHSDAEELQQVVITGYQKIQKKLFTGSSATIDAKDVEREGVEDVSRMLEGQVAGVSMQNVSGTFGAAPKLRVRGATSLSGDNKPLWVVDGIILEDVVNISNEALSTGDVSTLLGSSVAGLNPSDIESFTVLKDAAATALYGARAMNGVVVITTKKGVLTNGSPRISYNSNFSTYIKPSYSDFDILNSADQMGIMIELLNKGYYQIPTASRSADGGVFYKMYNMLYDYDEATDSYALRNDAQSKDDFLKRYANANTDWFDVLFKNSLKQEHSVSISSGTKNFQSYASTSWLHDDGLTLGNSVDRFTGSYRANFQMSKKISGEFLSSGSVRKQRAPGTQDQKSDPVYGSYYRGFDINPYNFVMNTSRMLTPYDQNGDLEYFVRDFAPFNIINELNTNYMKLSTIDFKVQLGLNYQIIPSLSYSVNGAYRFVSTENQTYILENSNLVQSYQVVSDATVVGSNPNLYDDPDEPNELPIVVLPSGGFYKIANNNLKNYYVRQNLNFHKKYADNSEFSAYGTMEMRYIDRQDEFFDGVGYQYQNGGLVSPYYKYFKEAAEEGKPYFGMGLGADRFLAYAINSAYNYKGRYTINATARYDGSNKMGESRVARWLPTWNVSGKWFIDEEKFWPENKIVTTAAIRATYGLVASIGSATNSSAVFYNQISRRPYIVDQETQTYISSLENSELTWEKSRELNLGLDASFINNRLFLTVDYYRRNIFDLIGPIQTSGIGGEFEKYGNYGQMHVRGFELTLQGKAVQAGKFSWNPKINLSWNHNEITVLDINPIIWKSVSGNGGPVKNYPQRGIFSVKFSGLDHNYGYPTFYGFNDNNKSTQVDLQSDDIGILKYEGPADPTFTGGFYTPFRYGNFGLSALFKFSAGNVIRLSPKIAGSYSDLQSMTKDMLNRWVLPGDEAYTSIPALLSPLAVQQITDGEGGNVDVRYPYNLYNYSDERVVSGDYIKLTQITLSYNLPEKLLKKLSMTNASLILAANNIWTIYSDKRLNGQDPEFIASGGVALPMPKQLTLAVKVGF